MCKIHENEKNHMKSGKQLINLCIEVIKCSLDRQLTLWTKFSKLHFQNVAKIIQKIHGRYHVFVYIQ